MIMYRTGLFRQSELPFTHAAPNASISGIVPIASRGNAGTS
jgi:hypothetical protein